MQFTLPQFTDVEDRIIAGLTFKQFGILFGTGVIVFVFYSITKSLVPSIILLIIAGLPALVLAFGKLNGRPLYRSIFSLLHYFGQPKVYVFHKDGGSNAKGVAPVSSVEKPSTARFPANEVVRIKQLAYVLEHEVSKETELYDKSQKT